MKKKLYKTRRQFLKDGLRYLGLALGGSLLSSPQRIYATSSIPTADTILINGKVITVDPGDAITEAVAIKGEKIIGVGKNQMILGHRGLNTRIIDLEGKTVTPGFIDSHAHLPFFGERESGFWLNLQGMHSKDEILQVLHQKARETPKGEWIHAWGIESNSLTFLTRKDLDKVSTDHPMIVLYTGGQWGFANSLALDISGIDANTKSPLGGKIGHSFFGREPTGLLISYPAIDLVRVHAPRPNYEQTKEMLLLAAHKYAREGVTTVHDNFVRMEAPQCIRAYFELAEKGELPLRMKIIPYVSSPNMARLLLHQLFPERCPLSGAEARGMLLNISKTYMGGDIERTEALVETGLPYCRERYPELFKQMLGGIKLAVDGGGSTAFWYANNSPAVLHSKQDYTRIFSLCHENGYQVTTHAIGDEAVDWVLDAVENAMASHPRKDHRHRIEHALCPKLSSRRKMKELDIVLSTHPQWLMAWGDKMTNLELFENSWSSGHTPIPLRSYLEHEIPMAFGADPPAYPLYQPQIALFEAVSRVTQSGYAFDSSEKISIQEALRIQTMGSAYAGFEEDTKGSIEKGKLADLVVWDRDFYTIPPEQLKEVKAKMTMMGGRITYPKT